MAVVSWAGESAYSYVNSNTNLSSAQATCGENTLDVTATLTIKAGFVATAMSFDATFCGAPCEECNCNSAGPDIWKRLISGHHSFDNKTYDKVTYIFQNQTFNSTVIVISGVELKSNWKKIHLTIDVTQPENTITGYSPGAEDNGVFVVFNANSEGKTYVKKVSNDPSTVSFDATLTSSSGVGSPYTGDAVVLLDLSKTQWGVAPEAGKYTITTTFTITPIDPYL